MNGDQARNDSSESDDNGSASSSANDAAAAADDDTPRISPARQRALDHRFVRAVLQRPPDFEAADAELRRGANVNANVEQEGIYISPIDMASVNGHVPLMSFLLERGADANHRAVDGTAPIHRAVLLGHQTIVNMLLESGHADPNLRDERSREGLSTPLQMVVALGGPVGIARSLVRHGADVTVRQADGRTLLHRVDNVELLEFLLEQGQLDVEEMTDNGCTPLGRACFTNNLPVAKRLVAAGADPNSLRNNVYTPLHLACVEGSLELVQWLVQEGGGDVLTKSPTLGMALHVACKTKQKDIAVWLMDECQTKPSIQNDEGCDALHLACKKTRENRDASEIVRELLRRDPNLGRGLPDSTPSAVHFAAEWSPDLCRLLVKEYGFDLMARSLQGSVPLCHATSVGTVETMNCLIDEMLKAHLDLNVGDVSGLTALHEAVLGGSVEKVRTLLDRGLNVNATSKFGETPLHTASLTAGNPDRHATEAETIAGAVGGQQAAIAKETARQTLILDLIIGRGAYALSLDRENMYPFMYAAKTGNVNKTFMILRAAAAQGFFVGGGGKIVGRSDGEARRKTASKRKRKDVDNEAKTKRARLQSEEEI